MENKTLKGEGVGLGLVRGWLSPSVQHPHDSVSLGSLIHGSNWIT